nr:DUF2809 domain-containing protein [Neobacillus mesonae]
MTAATRKRIIYTFMIIVTIILGLSSRKYDDALPLFVAENAGDMLWAMMVYFGFRFLLVRSDLRTAIILSLLFSFGIEFSQLYQADWINQLRGTVLGALILGHGFLAADLIRYCFGVMAAAVLDHMIIILKR